MTIIDRYVARTFVSSYLILLGVLIGLFILGDLLVNLDEFTEDKSLPTLTVLTHMLDYYASNVPLYFAQLTGPVMALAAGFTLGMLVRNNELTALIASGMPLQRLSVPIIVCSILLVALWVLDRELVIPNVAHRVARARDDIAGQRTTGIECARDANNVIVTAQRLLPRLGRMEGVLLLEPDETRAPTWLIEADAAEFDRERGDWRLERGRRVQMAGPTDPEGLGQRIEYDAVERYPLRLTPEQLVLRQVSAWSDMLSLRQMNELVASQNVAGQATIVKSRHVRLTQPVLQWILLLLTLPFFLVRTPGNVIGAGGRALLLTGLFFAATFLAHGMIKDSSAALMAWLPILVFGPLAVLQLANVKT